MVSDSIYDLCLPVLDDAALNEEDKTDKLEELLGRETSLTGRPLQDAIIGVLWRHRDATIPAAASPPPKAMGLARYGSPAQPAGLARHGSPAPWQVPRAATPLASPALGTASPANSSHGFFAPPTFPRAGKQSTASPFASPRPSPRLAFTSPIPHSPNLNSYEFSDSAAQAADYGDYGSDTVDWLVNDDDGPSRPTSSSATSTFGSSLSAAATPWVQPQQAEMSPYDMLRSILGESKSDVEIEAALEANGYDLSATVISLMGEQQLYEDGKPPGQVTVGKHMQTSQPIPIGQKGASAKNPVICKYWLATGSCLRSDCRFSHDYGNHICKYWIMGNCLAGDTCVFSHDPSALVANMNLSGSQPATSIASSGQPTFQVQDFDSFPALSHSAQGSHTQGSGRGFGFHAPGSHLSNASASPRPYGSRPGSRHSSRAATPSIPQVDDNEAFPALGSGGPKATRKHHGKRGGHGHNSQAKENVQDLRASPGPSPGLLRRGLMKSRSYIGTSREQVTSSNPIPPPEHIPWLETGDNVNQAYLKARQDAFKHGGLRNKFLQSAAQAWNRNDARAAKALSLRGQSENELMRKAHREAARVLYESRAKTSLDVEESNINYELYIDLHGLHPEDSIAYLARILHEQKEASESSVEEASTDKLRPLYVITGTGHHSKGGKDKVGKSVRAWLVDRGFVFREFSVPGDRGNVGGILGVDIGTGTVGPQDFQGHAVRHERTESMDSGADGGLGEDLAEAPSSTPEAEHAEKQAGQPVMQMRIPTGPKGMRV